MSRDVLPKFDPAANFFVSRAFKAAGREFAIGDQFDKSLVDVRRLRQMVDQRKVRQVAAKGSKRFRAEAA